MEEEVKKPCLNCGVLELKKDRLRLYPDSEILDGCIHCEKTMRKLKT